VLTWPAGTKVFVCTRATDMRCGFDALAAQVAEKIAGPVIPCGYENCGIVEAPDDLVFAARSVVKGGAVPRQLGRGP
jgi:hypothetical protein